MLTFPISWWKTTLASSLATTVPPTIPRPRPPWSSIWRQSISRVRVSTAVYARSTLPPVTPIECILPETIIRFPPANFANKCSNFVYEWKWNESLILFFQNYDPWIAWKKARLFFCCWSVGKKLNFTFISLTILIKFDIAWNYNYKNLDLELPEILSRVTRLGEHWHCTDCQFVSKRRLRALMHVEAIHVNLGGYNCPLCSKFCKSVSALSVHTSRHHGKNRTYWSFARFQSVFKSSFILFSKNFLKDRSV